LKQVLQKGNINTKNNERRCFEMTDVNLIKIGRRIKLLREDRNIRQDELGELIGIQKPSISRYEQGKSEGMDIKLLSKLADIFGVDVLDILDGDESISIHEIRELHIATKDKTVREIALLANNLSENYKKKLYDFAVILKTAESSGSTVKLTME